MTDPCNPDEELAIGVKVYDRTDKLEALLESVPSSLPSTVYIADDGPESGKAERRERIYSAEYPFDTEILELEYDTGLGYGRDAIVAEFDAEFLLMLDSDNLVPNNVTTLLEVMKRCPALGGVSGCLAEPPHHRITMMGADFKERDDALLLSPFFREKEIEFVDGYPLVTFDLVPNVGLYRRECLRDYSWDPDSIQPFDHEDFYLGHLKRTDWSFAICPQVLFPHYPGGDADYRSRRWRHRDRAEERFLNKWQYEAFKADSYSWFHGGKPNTTLEQARQIYFEEGLGALLRRSASFLRRTS